MNFKKWLKKFKKTLSAENARSIENSESVSYFMRRAYKSGFVRGYEEGYRGRKKGYSEGLVRGYEKGYEKGLIEAHEQE